MLPRVTLLSALLLAAIPGFALNKVEVADLAHHPLAAEFPAGGQLVLHLRSGEIRILGTDENKVTVHAGGKRGENSTDIHARFESSANDVTITVEVPRKSNLRVRVFAGEVEVGDIIGDKDVALSAGDLDIDVGHAADYGHVAASVTTGDINAGPFGESRDGLFRSFEKSGSGKYRLVAHVGAGELTLK